MKLALLTCAIAAALLGSQARASDCTLTAQSNNSIVQRSYDPFAFGNTVLDLEVKVRNLSRRGCQARVYVSPAGGALVLHSIGDKLHLRLDGNQGGGRARAGEFGPFVVQVPGGESVTVPVRLTIPAHQVVRSGHYSTLFGIRVEDREGNPAPLFGGLVAAVAKVPARAEMSISGTSLSDFSASTLAPANLAFGQAKTGSTRRVFVNIWANEAVTITLESENRGKLSLVGRDKLSPISYSARFDGRPVNLASTQNIRRAPSRSVAGTSYELALTLGSVESKFGGLYRDRITISVVEN